MSTRLRLEADLDGILTRRELAVRYQPVVRLDDRAVVAVTATPYWKHPDLGMISPTDLLTSAQATQMVERITRALIEEACRQMQQWRSAGAAPVDLHVLIPAALLRDDDLLAAIGGPALRYGIRPDQLVVEVDESTIAEDPPLVADRLEQMHRAGIRTAVTAFGNGGCSLRDLLRISADIVAIDVADAPDHNSANPPPLSQLLVRLAHLLDAAAMATGVDTHEQLVALDAAGYRYGRGSLFGCPADGTTTADRIRQAAVVHS